MLDWHLVERFGVAVVVLAVLFVAAWRFGAWSGKRVDLFLTRHTAFIDKVAEKQGLISEDIARHHGRLDSIHSGVGRIERKVDELLRDADCCDEETSENAQ